MKSRVLLIVLALALVGSAVWLVLPESEGTASPTGTTPAAEQGKPAPAPAPTREEATEIAAQKLAREQAGYARILAGQRKAFDQKIVTLAEKLALDPAQQGILQEHFEGRLDRLENLLAKGDEESLNAVAEILRMEGLDEILAEILTPTQVAALKARTAENQHRNATAQADEEINTLTRKIKLSAAQQQALRPILYQRASARYQTRQETNPYLALISDGAAIDSSRPPYIVPGNRRSLPPIGGVGSPPEELPEDVLDANLSRIDAELAPLVGILSEEQLESYREYLLDGVTEALAGAEDTTIVPAPNPGARPLPPPIFTPAGLRPPPSY